MKSLFVAIALVAACSVANAAEVKKDTTKAPAVSAKAMTDKDMDKVTAGAGQGPDHTAVMPNNTAFEATVNANYRNQSFEGRAANLIGF